MNNNKTKLNNKVILIFLLISKHIIYYILKKKTNNRHFLSIKKKSHVIIKFNGPSVQAKPLNNKIVINKKALEAFPLGTGKKKTHPRQTCFTFTCWQHVSHEKHKIYKLKWQDE